MCYNRIRRPPGPTRTDTLFPYTTLIRSAIAAELGLGSTGRDFLAMPDQQIQTAIGEIRRVPLSDGSLAAVNTQTTLDVTMKPELRQVALKDGESRFQVAKDRSRPFVVHVVAGSAEERCVGKEGVSPWRVVGSQ